MRFSFREGLYAGLTVGLALALFLLWLWQPEHQIELHSRNLLHSVAAKNWTRLAGFLDADYRDQWAQDRALALERTREVFQFAQNAQLIALAPIVQTTGRTGLWKAKITIEGEDNDVMILIKDRINSLPSPFALEWRKASARPWDWKLVRVSNPELALPSEL